VCVVMSKWVINKKTRESHHGIFRAAGHETYDRHQVPLQADASDGQGTVLHACPSEQSSPSWGHLTVALHMSEGSEVDAVMSQ
jgi:hypothetical protein